MKKKNMYLALAFMLMLSIVGCKKEKADPNEEELITTVKVKLTEKVLGGTGAITTFEFKDLDPKENYGQVYIRTDDIDQLYQSMLDREVSIHPAGTLQLKPWGQKEFSMLDPDNNLLTFGQLM